jgi:transcriptional regulator with XRE-family HTH domain
MCATSSYGTMKMGQKIASLMKGQRLSQSLVAEKTGIQQAHLSRVVNGKASLSLEQGLALARALGVSLDYLADDALDDPPPATEERSEADAMILALAKTWGYAQAAKRLQVIQPPPFAVDPPDRSPDAR